MIGLVISNDLRLNRTNRTVPEEHVRVVYATLVALQTLPVPLTTTFIPPGQLSTEHTQCQGQK